jgi:hypothetical protein
MQRINSGSEALPRIGIMNREKLMPYHVAAIKKNGISKEIHKINNQVVKNFYYSSEGLLIKSEVFEDDIIWSNTEFQYNEKKLVTIIITNYQSLKESIDIERDSSGKILSVKSGSYQTNYIYSNGILVQVGTYKKKPNSWIYEDEATYGYGSTYERYGRELSFLGGDDSKLKNTFDNYGKWISFIIGSNVSPSQWSWAETITYKNDLMNAKTKVYSVKIIDWKKAKEMGIKPEYTKTVTNITYEYEYRKKK